MRLPSTVFSYCDSFNLVKLFLMGSRGSTLVVDMTSTSAKFVESVIKQHKVVIFSKSQCPYCKSAKQVFKNKGVDFLAVELDEREDGGVVQDVLNHMTGARTVPRVFVNGQCIGGCTETKRLDEESRLESLLSEEAKPSS